MKKIFKNELPVNVAVLYIGVLNDYVNIEEVIDFINNNVKLLEYKDDFVVELNLNEGSKEQFLETIKKYINELNIKDIKKSSLRSHI